MKLSGMFLEFGLRTKGGITAGAGYDLLVSIAAILRRTALLGRAGTVAARGLVDVLVAREIRLLVERFGALGTGKALVGAVPVAMQLVRPVLFDALVAHRTLVNRFLLIVGAIVQFIRRTRGKRFLTVTAFDGHFARLLIEPFPVRRLLEVPFLYRLAQRYAVRVEILGGGRVLRFHHQLQVIA